MDDSGSSKPPQTAAVFDITPTAVVPGREYTVVLLRHDLNQAMDDKGKTKDTCKVDEETTLKAPGGINVSGRKVTSDHSLEARITIPPDVPLGKYRLLLVGNKTDKTAIIGLADIDVTIAPGPIPPGLEPQVDVMWSVMPKNIVGHNFGRQMANNYYGVQVRIGNNSGFALQIAGVGFKVRNSASTQPFATNSYRATRGTLEREQDIGARATLMTVVKSLGTLYSGFLPFWHMANRRANANLFGDIFNGPFEVGLGAVFPDLTAHQLTRLDDQTLRDGLVVPNNTQVVSLVWVPQKLLNLAKSAGSNDNEYLEKMKWLPKGSGSSAQTRATGTDKQVPNPDRNWKDDPQYVKYKLGEMVLVGQQISYLNRVQVVSSGNGNPVAPPPTAYGINPSQVEQSSETELTIPGSYLDNANPILKDPATNEQVSGVNFTKISTDQSGHTLKATIIVGDQVPPKDYTLVVSTPGGASERRLTIVEGRPSWSNDPTVTPKAAKDAQGNLGVTISITGKHLDDAKFIVPAESKDKVVIAKKDGNDIPPDRKDGKLTQELTVTGGKPGKYKLQVQNNNPNPVDLEFELKATDKRAGDGTPAADTRSAKPPAAKKQEKKGK
jgi:hypothetical protein